MRTCEVTHNNCHELSHAGRRCNRLQRCAAGADSGCGGGCGRCVRVWGDRNWHEGPLPDVCGVDCYDGLPVSRCSCSLPFRPAYASISPRARFYRRPRAKKNRTETSHRVAMKGVGGSSWYAGSSVTSPADLRVSTGLAYSHDLQGGQEAALWDGAMGEGGWGSRGGGVR